ncbi:MAG: phage holin family protein [Acidobacteriaceae bacterium]
MGYSGATMIRLLINWILSALALFIVAFVVPGFEVSGFGAAMWAALVVGFLNMTLGWVLHFVTFPLTVLTLGLFYFIVNAIILYLASGLVPGFRIKNFGSALLGALVLALVHYLLGWLW